MLTPVSKCIYNRTFFQNGGKVINNNFEKIAKVLVVALFLMTAAIPVAVIGASGGGETETNIHLVYTIPFTEPVLKENTLFNNATFTTVNMYGCINMGQGPGTPELPVYSAKILLPYGTELEDVTISGTSVEVMNRGINLQEKPVMPYQYPVPIGHEAPPFIMDENTYTSAGIIPDTLYDVVGVDYCRGYAILTLNIYPVTYNPLEGTLFYYPELTVDISTKQTGYINQFFRNIPDDRAWVMQLVVNPEVADTYHARATLDYPGGICDPSDHYDYVIITKAFLANFQAAYNWTDLINQKQMEGLAATVVTVEDIINTPAYWNTDPLFNDTTAKIREFCKDAYTDWGTQYVLIAGDQDGPAAIPRRLMDYAYESNVESDLYWSNLDNTFNSDHDNDWGEEGDTGFDLYSELYIGSIPCDEAQDISNWLKKQIFYTDAMDKDYLDNAAFYGGDTGWSCQGDDFIDFTLYGTNDWLGPDPHNDGPWPSWLGFLYGFDTWNNSNPGMEFNTSVRWTAEPPNPGWQGGSESAAIAGLKNAINNDLVTFIFGIAHANSGMSLDVYDDDWESDYHNTKPFFIHDYGCHCGDMDASDDGVLHSMLFHSDTELAFGCVYNTGYGWGNLGSTNSSSALQQKLFVDYLFNTSKSGGTMNWQLGKAQAFSKDAMAPTINWDPSYGTWRGIIESCLLFGDPAQLLKPPLVPEHNIGIQTLSVPDHVNPGELVYINATLVNTGKNNESNVHVSLRINGTEIDSITIPFFQKHTSQDVSFIWIPALGWYNVAINVTIPGVSENVTIDNEKSTVVIAGPDVAVSSLSAPPYASVGVMSRVEADIANLGASDEMVTVTLKVNNTVVDIITIWVENHHTEHITLVWNPSSEGTYPVTVTAEVAGEVYAGNNERSADVEVMISQGFVLLVDDDDGDSYESYFENALMAAGYIYEYWNRDSQGCPDASYMAAHMAVVWFTGDDYTSTLVTEDINALSTYLDNGGKLFITGQDIGYDIRTDPFYANYLHAIYNVDDTNIFQLNGISGDPIGDGLTIEISSGDGANNQNYPDGISPTGGSTAVFQYQGSSHYGAVKYEGVYKVVYFGFGFEAIDSNNQGLRTVVMQRVLNWLGGGSMNTSDVTLDDMNLDFMIPQGASTSGTVTIGNDANASADLTFDISFESSRDVDWISAAPSNGTLQPGETADIIITINGSGLTTNFTSATMKIITNDPDESSLGIPLYISTINELRLNFTLYTGWNLITIPVENNYTASDLPALIPQCDMIAW
ncbi:MAG: hypothetical protein DRN37_01815 [Thermoplasmata archaeon]|nr:MAG: hypothetical protein DRN37_01815 [Thermoplasmata archaeon]